MGKEFVFLFVLFMLLFVLKVTFFWDNFATYFFQSNGNTTLMQIILYQILHFIIFLHKVIVFSYNNIDIPFYRFPQQIIFLYLDNCYIININL